MRVTITADIKIVIKTEWNWTLDQCINKNGYMQHNVIKRDNNTQKMNLNFDPYAVITLWDDDDGNEVPQ